MRLLVTFLPLRSSTTSSVGIRIWPIWSIETEGLGAAAEESATFCSKPE